MGMIPSRLRRPHFFRIAPSFASLSTPPAAYAIWPLIASIVVKCAMSTAKWRSGRGIQSSDSSPMPGTIPSTFSPEHRPDRLRDDPDQSRPFRAADHLGGTAVGFIVIFLGHRVVRDTPPADGHHAGPGSHERIREVASPSPACWALKNVSPAKPVSNGTWICIWMWTRR